jgi:MFS family permease
MAALTAALGLSGTVAVYVVLLAMFGLATGVAGVAPAAMLSDVVPDRSTGTAIGLFRFCGDLGFILGPLAAGATTAAWGFRVSFALAAIPTLVALLFALRTPETNLHREPSERRAGPTPLGTG